MVAKADLAPPSDTARQFATDNATGVSDSRGATQPDKVSDGGVAVGAVLGAVVERMRALEEANRNLAEEVRALRALPAPQEPGPAAAELAELKETNRRQEEGLRAMREELAAMRQAQEDLLRALPSPGRPWWAFWKGKA